MKFSKKWSELREDQHEKIIKQFGSKQAWQDAKARSKGYKDEQDRRGNSGERHAANNPTGAIDPGVQFPDNGSTEQGPVQPKPNTPIPGTPTFEDGEKPTPGQPPAAPEDTTPTPTPDPTPEPEPTQAPSSINYEPETDQSKINHKTIEVKGNEFGYTSTEDEGFDSSKLPPPEEVTGSKWKDENYYKKLGIETPAAKMNKARQEAREKAQAAAPPMNDAQRRTAANEAIVKDRGSDNQINYQKDLEALKQETGYGDGSTGDIRQHLREQFEAGFVPNSGGQYAGRSWIRQEGNKGDQAATAYLKGIAYGDTPTSYNDVFHRNTEGYVPMAERGDVTWKMWTPSGGSDKEAYFKGMHELKTKYGYTDLDYDTWNNERIASNRALADRHGHNVQSQMDAGLIDKYGNPIPQDY